MTPNNMADILKGQHRYNKMAAVQYFKSKTSPQNVGNNKHSKL